MKRGVEMSMQLVVIAVIVLLVAALLIYFVAKTLKKTDEGVSSCTTRGAAYSCKTQCGPDEQVYMLGSCGKNNQQVCCVAGGSVLG